MENTQKRIKNSETLLRVGKQMRQHREQAGIAQGKVRGMRQATVSKIENGGDVTLDTLITYAAALGLELALVPVGQALAYSATQHARTAGANGTDAKSLDLLSEFSDLRDEA